MGEIKYWEGDNPDDDRDLEAEEVQEELLSIRRGNEKGDGAM